MSEFRPYERDKLIAAAIYPVKAKPKPKPLPDAQMEADAVAWREGGCVGPCVSIIRPMGKPNLRLV